MKKISVLTLLLCWVLFFMPGCCQRNPTAGTSFWADNAGTPSQRFQLAKQSTPELIAFMRRMPKGADLHNHAGGAAYSDFILDRAEKEGVNYNIKTNTFTTDNTDSKDVITVEQLKKNSTYLSQFLNVVSMRGWYPNTTNGHDHFFSAFRHLRFGKSAVENVLVEIIKRNRYQNVQYLELMIPCIPFDVINKFQNALTDFDIKNLDRMFAKVEPLLDDPGIQSSIHDFLDQWDKGIMQRLEWKHPVTGSEGPLVIRFIPQLYRLASLKDFFISAVYTMLTVKIDERVVALNVVAPEDMPASRQNFTAQMEILDFLWAKMGKPNITLHAGELSLRLSPVEPMRNRIRDSIEKGHARRIGHGVSIAWEDDVMGLLKKMREQGILVEICLTSNESILGVKGKDHPFLLYRRAGVPISINTDDEGISRSNLTMEYIKAIQRYDLKYEEVKEIIRNSIEYSFLPGKSIFENRDYSRLLPAFKSVRSQDWQPDEAAKKSMKANPKLNRQVILERALVEFEKFLLNGLSY